MRAFLAAHGVEIGLALLLVWEDFVARMPWRANSTVQLVSGVLRAVFNVLAPRTRRGDVMPTGKPLSPLDPTTHISTKDAGSSGSAR